MYSACKHVRAPAKSRFLSQLIQGSFGTVFLALERRTRKTVVVKQVRVPSTEEEEEQIKRTRGRQREKEREALDVQREVQLLSQLSHVHIVEYVESFANKATG